MSNTTVQTGAAAAPKSLPARFIGIIVAPRATFESIVAHPKWFGMLALCAAITTVLVGGFFMTQVGQDAWLDTVLKPGMPTEQIQMMEKMAPFAGYITIGSTIVFMPIVLVVCAAILFAVFNAAMGGNATFKQVFTVVVHSFLLGPIAILSQLFTMPLSYFRGTMANSTNLAVLFPFLEEGSFAANALGTIDIFLVWQLIVLAIGLGVLYRRRTQPIATTFFVIYALVAVIVGFVKGGAA